MGAKLVYVCNGSGCRKKKAARQELLHVVHRDASVREVRCQKVCKGLVVGCEIAGRLEWFEDVTSNKARRQLSKLLNEGKLKKALKKRKVKKRSGKLR